MDLGSRSFSIAPAAALAVPVKLTPRAFERLTRAKRLSAHVVVRGAATASRTIMLLAP
jgi:hypothetical protein